MKAAIKRYCTAAAAVLLLSVTTLPAFGQATSSSSIAGIVTDQQEAAIPGADVLVTDASTNQTISTKSNAAGRYIFINVNSGTYSLTVTKEGFSTFRTGGLSVQIGTSLTINAILQIGSTTTTVEVVENAGAELVTSSAAVGSTLTNSVLEDLPNMGRDVSTLAVLQPGTTMTGFTAGSVNDQNTYQIDGGNASDDMAGNTTGYQTNFTGVGGTQQGGAPSGVIPTPVESIEEFKVSSFNQTADFNNSIGGQVQMATKRGTNTFHGSGYGYYFATNVGAANSWVNNHTPSNGLPYTPLPSNHRSRFGTSLGGPLTPKIAGGKTFFFFNYEALRFPNVGTIERLVPTATMRAGVIEVPDSSGVYRAYNLNPSPVTVNGVTYAPATCGAGLCDPRGIGINPLVKQLWQQYMPLPNDLSYGGTGADDVNTAGYLGQVRAPLSSNVYVARVDHDFGDKLRWMSSYRYMRLSNLTTNQLDIGGAFAGNTLGQPAATAPRPQLPSFFVTGLTWTVTPNIVNDFHYSFTRNYWSWGDNLAPPQLAGLGAALEIAQGTSATAEGTNALIPYNVNTQSIRTRFWDGKDHMLSDNVTWIKGKHLIQMGGTYQHNWNFHTRTDNGVGINNQAVYQITSTNINFASSPYIPSTVAASSNSVYAALYSEVLGLVGQPQVAYTRSGNNLTLNPYGSSAFDKASIPYYSTYAGDTWKLRPSLTLSYSLGYTIEMPPVEETGKQVMVVDPSGNPIITQDYIAARKAAALAGQVYNPNLGFALVGNVAGGGRKYPYDPFYGMWSPRASAAWNPKFRNGLLAKVFGDGATVIRGGYSRIWGRTNGVAQVLNPLLGVGLIQAVTCQGPNRQGVCAGANAVDPSNVFRIGVDGNSAPIPAVSQTLAQPYYPGVNGNTAAGDASALDPHLRPQVTDNFTLSIQRQIGGKVIVDVGFMGRIIGNENNATNLDAIPYMTTLGGQQFSNAYATTYFALANGTAPTAIPVQPFFESALGGAGSASCKAFASCTAYVASTFGSQIKGAQVSDLWASLNRATSWTMGRTGFSSLPNQGTSLEMTNTIGYGNYNALYITMRTREFHNATILSNFTWGRGLGTAASSQSSSSYTQLDAFNIDANYGPNSFDFKFLYNLAMSYKTPWFKDQKSILGRVAGGWTVAPLFIAQSGAPIGISYTTGSGTAYQSFGQSSSTSISSYVENAVQIAPVSPGNSAHYGVAGSNGIGTNNATGLNLFSDPATVYNSFRKCILGYDTSCGGYGNLRGLPIWNLDASLSKNIFVAREGRIGATLSFQFTNVLNHFQPANPSSLALTSPTTFGRITASSASGTTTVGNTPRNVEFGLRVHF
jgi:hypothetical protein